MTRLVALILLVLAVACRRAASDDSRPTASAPTPVVTASATDADPACDSLVAAGRRTLDIEFRRTDERQVENPFVGAERKLRPGCRVTASDSTGRAPDPVYRMYAALEAGGWQPLLQYQADGPDGSVTGFLREGVICVVTGRWDGGDDADSTYVPEPGYGLEGICFGAEAADTMTRR